MSGKLNLSSPWVLLFHEYEAFFKEDPDVKVLFDEDDYVIRILVKNSEKADALSRLLPSEKQFGNVTVTISVIPAVEAYNTEFELFQKAFKGNPAVSYTKSVPGLYNNTLNFIVFKNKVVQYFTDDLGDINHVRSTLYQDIAKELFGEYDGIFYCTDKPEP